MPPANGSHVDELLRYMRIADAERLVELEQDFAGSIKLGPAGRYGCRLLADGDHFEFKLGSLPNDEEAFFVTRNGMPFEFKEGAFSRRLWELVRHRAAEVIGAVRGGHHEYNVRPKHRRKKSPAAT